MIELINYFELGNMSYFIPESIISSKRPFLKIITIGNEDILWEEGRLIARAELVENRDFNNTNPNVFMVNACIGGDRSEIKQSDIDVGNLR